MRVRCTNMIHELARRDERVVYIGSDLSPGLLDEMKAEFPTRHFMEGITEAHLVGMAAGMAMEGLLPYVHTIATFITRRCYEQVAIDLCLHDLPVRLIGNGGGYVYAPLGATHQSIEDLAIMRALPNMTVTAACDADEMTRLMEASLEWPHPMYIRLAKGGDPIISDGSRGFEIGRAVDMTGEAGQGADVLLVSTGVATTQALSASQGLVEEGITCRLLHLHTVKPIDTEALVEAAASARLVVTVEEHTVVGGLGSAVLETLSDGLDHMPKLRRLGIPDRFSENYGSQADLMGACGFDAEGIQATVVRALTRL
ncbi:MAG: transketolase [Gemmatimonadaceae bacterium]|nr:transketolase [Gemmatimonadaceae bacterium]